MIESSSRIIKAVSYVHFLFLCYLNSVLLNNLHSNEKITREVLMKFFILCIIFCLFTNAFNFEKCMKMFCKVSLIQLFFTFYVECILRKVAMRKVSRQLLNLFLLFLVLYLWTLLNEIKKLLY